MENFAERGGRRRHTAVCQGVQQSYAEFYAISVKGFYLKLVSALIDTKKIPILFFMLYFMMSNCPQHQKAEEERFFVLLLPVLVSVYRKHSLEVSGFLCSFVFDTATSAESVCCRRDHVN